ncbi:CynX/NimT family MFS transporter [Luteimonas lutimaris]|uniref:MFS transporter n=1 Tax=Luteimonas lutimaris TaxID=698645 RepID=A0ABP7ME09_9GAMM
MAPSTAPTASGPAVHPHAATGAATHWPGIVAVLTAGLVAALQIGKVAPVLGEIRADLALDLRAGGWLIAVFGILGVLASVPAGALVSRFGDRRLQLAGLAAMAAGSGLGALAGSASGLLATRVLEGAGFLLFAVSAASVVQRLVLARHRNLVFSALSCYLPAGMAIALAIGPVFPNWRGFWAANAVLCLGAAAAVFRCVPGGTRSATAARWRAIARDALSVARSRGPLLLALAFAMYALQFYALSSFLPTLLGERMHLAPAAAGLLVALAIGCNVIGNLASTPLLSRGVPRWMLVAAASAATGACASLVLASSLPLPLLLALCLLFYAAGGLIPAAAIGGVAGIVADPRLLAIAMGLLMQGSYLGQVAGPALYGSVVQASGWTAAAIPTAFAAVAMIVFAVLLRPVFAAERN